MVQLVLFPLFSLSDLIKVSLISKDCIKIVDPNKNNILLKNDNFQKLQTTSKVYNNLPS